MTKEEIIRNLKYTMEKHKNDTVNTFGTNIPLMCKDILDYLEQEPCRDSISRQAVKQIGMNQYETDDYGRGFKDAIYEVLELPTVIPQSKMGHWEQYGNFWEDKFKCSECRKEQPKILCGERIIGHWSDYCPNCGAKMESEVKV